MVLSPYHVFRTNFANGDGNGTVSLLFVDIKVVDVRQFSLNKIFMELSSE